VNGSAAIFYCDRSGVMAQPWADAGYECWCIDIAHSIRVPQKVGNINFVWGDVRSFVRPTRLPIAFFAAFPPCTDVAGSGARDFALKGGVMLRDALEIFEACHAAASWSGAPYCIENPVGVLANVPHIGKPDFYFEPWHFAADDPNAEAYTKKTCLWTGNGFRFPDKRSVEPALGSAILKMPPSDDRERLRSLTPQGFARAVFAANSNAIQRAAA
jgi:hypothetical protein